MSTSEKLVSDNLGGPGREFFPEGLRQEEIAFSVLRVLALAGSLTALFAAPRRPEHELHLWPLVVFFIVYKLLFFGVLWRYPRVSRQLLLLVVVLDPVLVFFLVWFTGGAESQFYLVFYLLIALDAYYFSAGVGVLSALVSGSLYVAAALLSPAPSVHWTHIASRVALFGLLGLTLGHVAGREHRARVEAERLNRQLQATLKRLEEAHRKLLQAERLATIGSMSAKMAHEIRNPLGAVSLNLEILADVLRDSTGKGKEEPVQLLRVIQEQVEALAGLTEEYLAFSRLPRPKLEEESLSEVLDEIVAFVGAEAVGRRVSIRRKFDPGVPPFAFDRGLLRGAVLNLLKNALEALPGGGEVTVGSRRIDGWVEVTVEDSGPGIDRGVAERIFEPFFTTKERGTGLGLSIAQEVAREHGGELAWESRPGQGTTFKLRLPLKGEGEG